MADADLEAEREASKQQAARNYSLRSRMEALETRLRDFHGEDDVIVPADLGEFQMWCAKYLSGTVEVLNRAVKGVKGHLYEHPHFSMRLCCCFVITFR